MAVGKTKIVVAELLARMGLDTGEFEKSLDRADKKALKDFRKSIKQAHQDLTDIAVGFATFSAAAFAAGGIVVKSAIDSASAVQDTATALGISAQALSGLGWAAAQSGVESEAFSKSLTKMNLAVSEAATGTGPAADAFKRLGLDVGTLLAMTPDERFKAIADAMGGVSGRADQAAISTDIFGKAGTKLLPVMDMGSAGLRSMEAEAKRLGISLTDADFSRLESAGDDIAAAEAVFKGLGNTLAIEVAPYIKDFSDSLKRIASEDSVELKSAIEATVGTVVFVFESAIMSVNGLRIAFGLLHETYSSVLAEMVGMIGSAYDGFRALAGAVGLDPGPITALSTAVESTREVANEATLSFDTLALATLRGATDGAAAITTQEIPAINASAIAATNAANLKVEGNERVKSSEEILTAAIAAQEAATDSALKAFLSAADAQVSANNDTGIILRGNIKSLADIEAESAQATQSTIVESDTVIRQSGESMALARFQSFHAANDNMVDDYAETAREIMTIDGAIERRNREAFRRVDAETSGLNFEAYNPIMGGRRSAGGNVFDAGGFTPYATGGIVTSPTFFQDARGGNNVMGEAGPEAIMPLVRDNSGNLGVRSVGGSGGGDKNVTINLVLDGKILASTLYRMSNTGALKLNERALVNSNMA